MESNETVRQYYNSTVDDEWTRIAGRPEFILTCRFIDRYAAPGARVLDIGGGPGRYSLHLAQRGCEVTLLDLAEENVKFAAARAAEAGLALGTVCADAREADKLVNGQFDCVLLMGPLYHLLEEADRVRAVEAALALLKPGGVLFASFINMFSGYIYAMKFCPEIMLSLNPSEQALTETYLRGESYAGAAFTEAFFIQQSEVEPFMARFPLEKLHLFSQESITSPCEANIMGKSEEISAAWLDFAEKICERPELLSWGEHFMYVGRKTEIKGEKTL